MSTKLKVTWRWNHKLEKKKKPFWVCLSWRRAFAVGDDWRGGCGRRNVREKRKREKRKRAMRRVRGNLRVERVSESESGKLSSSWLVLRQCLFMGYALLLPFTPKHGAAYSYTTLELEILSITIPPLIMPQPKFSLNHFSSYFIKINKQIKPTIICSLNIFVY